MARVLTDDQKQQLRDKMQSLRQNANNQTAGDPPVSAATAPSSQPNTIARAGNGAGNGAGKGAGKGVRERVKEARVAARRCWNGSRMRWANSI